MVEIRKAQRNLGNREKQQTVPSPSLAPWEAEGKLKTQSQGQSEGPDNKLEILAARKAHTSLNPVKGFGR
jgi:hypothetical protein